MPTLRRTNTKWEVSSKVIVAVTWLADTVCASDDDVRAQRVASTEGSVGLIGWADELSGSSVIGDLRTGKGGRGDEEESRVHHLVCIQKEVFKSMVWLLLLNEGVGASDCCCCCEGL